MQEAFQFLDDLKKGKQVYIVTIRRVKTDVGTTITIEGLPKEYRDFEDVFAGAN